MQALRRSVRTFLLPGLLVSGIAVSAADERSFATWSEYLGGSDSAQYSSLKQINKSNVKQLEVAWTYPTGTGTFIFDPIVVDGVMYVLKAGTPPPPRAAPAQPGGRGSAGRHRHRRSGRGHRQGDCGFTPTWAPWEPAA